ncbi:MAG TPA: penicillin-binding protein 2 [Candidatus Limnocylindrales bacterium]|nr:penicillin-binding protein 2 [Candidatus Limnocylindrales bacterium]
MTETVSPRRLRVIFALFACATLLLSLRVGYWQTIGRAQLLEGATDQVRSDLVLAAQRGVVRDRAGAMLATTVPLRSLYAIPERIADHAATAAKLAPLLGSTSATVQAALDSGAEWLYLRRRLPEDAARAIESLAIAGLGFETEPKRLYPNDAIAAHVLGFVNDDGVGQYGIEGRYDALLRGVPGRLVVERDPKDRDLAVGLRTARPAVNGADLTLTIDLVVQTAAERELRAAMEKEKATGGSVVILDPRDGAILALASYPSYDPAAVAKADPQALMDRAVSWTFEPGSTMKAITIAAAIDRGAVTPNTTYEDKGCTVIGGRRLCNAGSKSYGTSTITQILEHSANAGAVFVAQQLGAEQLHSYLGAFGFGAATGVDLAAEAVGDVRALAEWYPVDLGTIAFGQGVAVTPLQLAAAYAAIANGGTLYRPYVVAAWRDADGEHRTAPAAVRRPISADTAATLRVMLTSTVDKGIANLAAIPHYSVAGKTGTAQIPSDDGRYVDDAYISSFAGFAPANDPRFVAVVVLERPQSKLLGTVTAMTTFRNIAGDALRSGRVQPDRP